MPLMTAPSLWTRRQWLRTAAAGGVLAPLAGAAASGNHGTRRFHVCLSAGIVESDPALLDLVHEAGVEAVWLAGFFYGYQAFPLDQLQRARERVQRAGMEAHLINVPLGHPGDSLGARDGDFPLSPPQHWKLGRQPDGKTYAGTSLHAPATEENSAALQRLRVLGFRQGFLDDDFRLARGPGSIGGCFCDEHRERFLRVRGCPPTRWAELLDDVRVRRLTPWLRAWVNFTCDELTGSFRAQRRVFGGGLGTMVMYLGAEKAGLRLEDYRGAPLRVGELMFDDGSFHPVKGKTDELFSALFHRRYVSPERAFSETTAFPADRLSARNMAAKLVVSTLSDTRNTMFMSGLTPFPRGHWPVLAGAMRDQAALHAKVAGHRPRGPFKHVWGEAQRLVGDDRPFSLWLALGVPFEVIPAPSPDGWNFISDYDARELAVGRSSHETRWVCRDSAPAHPSGAEVVQESLAELFAFKRRWSEGLRSVPHVVEEEPAVCAWYPSAGQALIWNLSDESKRLTVRWGARERVVALGPLAAAACALHG